MTIRFNYPYSTGNELAYIEEAMKSGVLSGNGPFTKKCQAWIENNIGCNKALLTHSCTAALEMAAILIEVGPGDEVIMPSFTFVSTANAFVLRGATPVFVDIREDTLNLDESLIEEVIEVLRMNRKDEWIDFHNMRIIKYGSDLHVDAHITLPFYWKLEKVHEEMDAVDDLLNRNSEIANIEVFIHPDPCLPVLCEHCLVKDCAERKSNFREEVKWTKEGMMKNRKLGLN